MDYTLTSAHYKADESFTFNERLIRAYALSISLFFLVSTPIAVIYTQEWDFWENLWHILSSPCKLVTDYFALGGLGSTLFNTAICGLFANLIIYISKVRINATTLAGYMLIVAHGSIFGCVLIMVGLIIPPAGIIDGSVLTAVGEIFGLSGGCIGVFAMGRRDNAKIDYMYRYLEDKRNKEENYSDDDTDTDKEL